MAVNTDVRCSICRDSNPNPLDAKLVPCGHQFHKTCVDPWLALHNTCPIENRVVTHLNDKGTLKSVADPNVEMADPFEEIHFETVSIDELNVLIQNGLFHQNHRGKAVLRAAKIGRIDILQTLLQNGPIPELTRGWAVLRASEIGRLDIVQALLQNGPIHEFHRSLSVTQAENLGFRTIVQTLLQNRLNEEYLTSQTLIDAEGHSLRTVFRSGRNRLEFQMKAIGIALSSGRYKIAFTLNPTAVAAGVALAATVGFQIFNRFLK